MRPPTRQNLPPPTRQNLPPNRVTLLELSNKKKKLQPRARTDFENESQKKPEPGAGKDPSTVKSNEERIGAERHTCKCGRSWPTSYGNRCHECGRAADHSMQVEDRVSEFLKPPKPDGELVGASGTSAPAPPSETVEPDPGIERWCPMPECPVTSWRGSMDSLCWGCHHPGVDQEEATPEQRLRIAAELSKAAKNF